jgi:hypothetical protein
MDADAGTVNESTRWLAQLGVGGAIAVIIFFFYRRDLRSYSELWQLQAADNRLMTDRVIGLVETTTRAATELTAVVHALHERLDNAERAERSKGG